MTYRIERFRENRPPEILKTGLTLEEAQFHCNNPETSSSTCSGQLGPTKWFDGYRDESRLRRRPSMLEMLAELQTL